MTLEILKPDTTVYNGEVISVTVPGVAGSFEVLNNHAPIISPLENGTVVVRGKGKEVENFVINGGVIEVLNNKITVLAEGIVS